MERQEIQLTSTVQDIMVAMAEGNPGALTVLARMLKQEGEGGLLDILLLDDMNIRGTQVWIAFKDHCQEDLPTFIKAIRARDQAMLDTVNAEGKRGNHEWKAVKHGATKSGARTELRL